MQTEKIETLIIGGGQAGIAMSEHLTMHAMPHLVVERYRIAERWRSERWDSLVTNSPAWHDRFPNMEFADIGPDSFVPKERVADYFAAYAKQISAPVSCGVEVNSLHQNLDGAGFIAETHDYVIEAQNVVVATGPFQRPVFPSVVPAETCIFQIHSSTYRNPVQLPDGAVLVVGSGASGVQIADELLRARRRVYLSVGTHNRLPRRYRGIDYSWWLGVLGKWDVKTPGPDVKHIAVAVSGARGGYTVDLRQSATEGITLLGTVSSFANGALLIAPDIPSNIQNGDDSLLALLDEADAFAKREGLDLPEEPEARLSLPDPECLIHPILKLDLNEAGITSIVWATGYTFDFSWIKLDAFDEKCRPKHERGVSVLPGLYFLGLPWLSDRSSSFIWGVWRDAGFLASHIAGKTSQEEFR